MNFGVHEPTDIVKRQVVSYFFHLTLWHDKFYKEKRYREVDKGLKSWINVQGHGLANIPLELFNRRGERGSNAFKWRKD